MTPPVRITGSCFQFVSGLALNWWLWFTTLVAQVISRWSPAKSNHCLIINHALILTKHCLHLLCITYNSTMLKSKCYWDLVPTTIPVTQVISWWRPTKPTRTITCQTHHQFTINHVHIDLVSWGLQKKTISTARDRKICWNDNVLESFI